MKRISDKKVLVDTSYELTNILENDNSYNYIYLGNNISLENGIYINENKSKITIDGTYLGIRYKLTGLNSIEEVDTISISTNTKEVIIKNIDIESTNTHGIVFVPLDDNYKDTLITFENIKFRGTELSYNPYGTVKIVEAVVDIETINDVDPQKVCDANRVILGGNSVITNESVSSPIFYFRSDTLNPAIIFLCKSRITLSTATQSLMNGTNKLNFTILHDTEVNLTTGNGFASYTIHGANNVLIEERASLTFIENKHQRVPMWSVFGNFIMKEGAKMQLINSFDTTPVDNYNIHFKGNNQRIILDNPKQLVIYTKNANVIYTDNPLEFKIRGTRINFWTDSTILANAGTIHNLPDYYWYKENDLVEIEGEVTSTTTTINKHNLTIEELSDFSFQSKKQFSIGNVTTNIHMINNTRDKISGHTVSLGSILIKYNDIEEIVNADSDGLFEYILTTKIDDNTDIEITTNNPSSFLYETRKIKTPYKGELSLMDTNLTVVFTLTPISTNPILLPKNKELQIKVVDSRSDSTKWHLYTYINDHLTSQLGYILPDALIFKKFDDSNIILNKTPQLVYEGSTNDNDVLVTTITYSKDKGPLIDLSNNYLEVNEEYFADIYFKLEE